MTAAITAQADQAVLAQSEVLELMDRLTREGIDWRIVLTGTSTAIADVLMRNIGPAEPSIYFARLSAATMHLATGA